MEEKTKISMNDVIEKIKDIDGLPSFEETRELLYFIEDGDNNIHNDWGQGDWWKFCDDCKIHQVYNLEFINELAGEIRKLPESGIVEICAGRGDLSHRLGKQGVHIIATDDYSWELSTPDRVEKLSHREALAKYKPEIVLASWIPYRSRIGFDVLDFPSVRYFIDIEEDVGAASWLTREIYERNDFERIYLKNVEKYGICKTDYNSGMNHSCVSLFRRK
jgi:hypothetical protein